jgi:hypothetical protein
MASVAGPVTSVDVLPGDLRWFEYLPAVQPAYEQWVDCSLIAPHFGLQDFTAADILPALLAPPEEPLLALFRPFRRELEGPPLEDHTIDQLEALIGAVILGAPLLLRAMVMLPLKPRRRVIVRARRVESAPAMRAL